jgi:hypothetical protein
MGRRFLPLSVLGILLASSAAHAGLLTNATWFQVIQGVPMTRTYEQLGIDFWTFSTQNSIAVNLSYPFLSTTFFVPKTPNGTLDLAIQITQGGPQAITATANMANATPGIPGTVVVRTAIHVGMGANQSSFMVGAHTIVAVPLSIGKAGQFTNTFLVTGALHGVTVDFYAWSPGSFMFTGLTTKGAALPNVTAMGSFNPSNATPSGGKVSATSRWWRPRR